MAAGNWILLTTLALVLSQPVLGADPKEGAYLGSVSLAVSLASEKYDACYLKENEKATPPVVGKMEVKVVIRGDGKVMKAHLGNSTLKNSVIENCVVDVVKGLKFPAPEDQSVVEITYPFAFGEKIDATEKIHLEVIEKKKGK